MINITPHKETLMTCFEAEVCSVARWMNKSYEMMFLDSWGINYINNENSRIGYRMFLGDKNTLNLLEDYHGIKVLFVENSNTNSILELIFEQLQSSVPITLRGNMYWLPWCDQYLTVDAPGHAFTVIGYNKKLEIFYCMDCNFSSHYQAIKKEELINSLNGCYIYSVNNSEQTKDITEVLYNHLENIILNKRLKAIDEIAKVIALELDLNYEFQGFELHSVPIFVRMTKIANGRLLFGRALNYIGKKNENIIIDHYTLKMKEIAEKWFLLRNIIVRYHMSNMQQVNIRETLAKGFEEISEYENAVLLDFLNDLELNLK